MKATLFEDIDRIYIIKGDVNAEHILMGAQPWYNDVLASYDYKDYRKALAFLNAYNNGMQVAPLVVKDDFET